MGVNPALKSLNQIASFLKVQPGKISLNEDSLPTRVINKNASTGYVNVILQLLQEANSYLEGNNELEMAEIRQWIEYSVVYLQPAEAASFHQVLQELNAFMATRTFLVSHRLTIADIFLYYALQNIVENLSILEKEKYLHVSRWFDNLQQNKQIRQSNKMVDFNTLYLASVVPARH